jgi:hypothetical protein
MKPGTPELIADLEIAAGVPKADGFCWCGHCHHVVKVCQHDVDRLETAWAGGFPLLLKCPRCHHHKVRLRFPQVVKPRAPKGVSPQRAHDMFALVFAAVQRN